MLEKLPKMLAGVCAGLLLSNTLAAQVIIGGGGFAPSTQPSDPEGAMLVSPEFFLSTVRPPTLEKGTYLGLNVTEITPELSAQLKTLPQGAGLVVQSVEEGSPAAAAGIKQYDILEKLDDQLLIAPRQLIVLVRAHKAGDEIKLSVIHESDRAGVTVKLAEKDVPTLDWQLHGLGDERMLINGGGAMPDAIGMAPLTRSVTSSVGGGVPGFIAPGRGTMRLAVHGGNGQMVWADPKYVLTLDTKQGKPDHFKAVDAQSGKVAFDGSVASDADRVAVPAELKDRLDSLIKQMNQSVPPTPWGGQ